jgi:hypothetical protein
VIKNEQERSTAVEAAVEAAEAEVADAETVGNKGKQVVTAVNRWQQR